ncbi:hypothetical protein [Mesorhizobium sp. B1-1-6]|uniref:hypothetical protein n=1 Tax=Mesorhizobium sp. B1-1-6 TaxID=2589978 RepID=UPI001125B324|nr:hypothetical protein [Mesorhizobium sp. B1-1-6]TPN33198.1 hypothetical protein FJ979_25030 [Mesorhizobium sp. B1-1-6]
MEKKRELKFGDDMVGALSNWGEKALIPVSIVGGRHMERRNVNRGTFKENDIKLTEAHAFACSAFMNLVSRSSGKKIDEDPNASQQINLLSHFMQGIHLCEEAIAEGLYVQAATLLRQEHEIISAVQELGIGRRKEGKTPHATIGVLKNMGKVYGDLSGAAHVSQSQLLHDIVEMERGELRGPSAFPIYHRDLARNLYSLHVCYIVLMGRLTSEIHDAIGLGRASEDEEKMMVLAIATLHAEGLIDIEEAPLDKPIAEPEKAAE